MTMLIGRVADDIRAMFCVWHARRIKRRNYHLTMWFNAIEDKSFRERLREDLRVRCGINIVDVPVSVSDGLSIGEQAV